MVLELVKSKPPTYTNGTIFHEFNQRSSNTDYTSKGEAYSKFIDSASNIYSIPRSLIGYQNLINKTVLNNPRPFVDATYEQNLKAFNTGRPTETSSSPCPTFSFYNSNITTVIPQFQNAVGSEFNYIRPKNRHAAYVKDNGDIDTNAMRNSMRSTNGSHYTDTQDMEPITEGLYASSKNNYLSMPTHPKYPDKDVTIATLHNNNSRYGQYPDNDFVNVIRYILPNLNKNGFKTYAEAENARDQIAASAINYSTQTLVKDFIIVKSKNKHYLLPAFD